MSRLFIIGNGFDSSHGMETSYKHFKKHLLERYEVNENLEEVPEVPGFSMMPDGEIAFEHEGVVRLVVWLLTHVRGLDKDWNQFETALGELDYQTILDEASWILRDENEFHEAHNYEDFSSDLAGAVLNISKYFSDWILGIKISGSVKRAMVRLIEEDSLALNFNYTETLERLYGMKPTSICYIHGDRRKTKNLIIGHGRKEERPFQGIHFAALGHIEEIQEQLRKNPKTQIEQHEKFFELLHRKQAKITEIYSYGFSFGEVDLPYITEICARMDTSKITWYQNDYDKKSVLEWKMNQIRKCGYKGTFSTFHVAS